LRRSGIFFEVKIKNKIIHFRPTAAIT